MYREEQYKCAKLAPRLIAKACWPTSFERQNVNLALKIFCESTSSAIKIQNLSRRQIFHTHTSDFIDVINQLWKLFNINRPNKNIRLNDDISEQFYYNDVRFGFLAKVVDWLDYWKSLPEKDGKLSAQTFTSMKHSCLALPRIVNYLIKECGFTYFLTYFLQTDALEHHFGLYRMMSGGNYHISYCQLLESERRLKVSTILNLFSNLHSNELTLANFISSFSATTDDTQPDINTPYDTNIYSSVILKLSDISLDTYSLQSLAFIGEYTVQQLWKHLTPCTNCMMFLTEDKYFHFDEPLDSKYKLLDFIDRGNLKWPSDIVLDAVVLVWKIFRVIEHDNYLLAQFAAGSSRKILVTLSIKSLEDVQCEHWRNKCQSCNLFGWDYLKRILIITSNCIIANKVKNFNYTVVSLSRERQTTRKLKKLTRPRTTDSKVKLKSAKKCRTS